MFKKPHIIIVVVILIVVAVSAGIYLSKKYVVKQPKHFTVLKLNGPIGSFENAKPVPQIYGEITRIDNSLGQMEIKSKPPSIELKYFKPVESVWRVSTVSVPVFRQTNGGLPLPAATKDLRLGQTVRVEYLKSSISRETGIITPLQITIIIFKNIKP